MIPASLSTRPARGLAVLALAAGLSGCLGGNEHEIAPARPAILSFTASPSTVAPGGSTVLSWNVTGADTVSIAPGLGQVTGTSITVRPVESTTYVLTATNAGGTNSASVTVNMGTPPAGLTYGRNPVTYPAGVAIVPNVPSSTGGAITSYAVSPSLPAGLSLDPTTGAISGTPTTETATATYTVTGSNAAGATTVALVLTVGAPVPPTISSFTATPPSVAVGGSTVLAWTVTGATTLSIDQGVGPVVGTSTTVIPVATTTYRLSATNAGGTSSADVTVLVTGAPTNLRYATNPATYMAGVAIAANAPAWGGGTPTSFTGTVAPGLVLDPTTGIVTGTPVTVAPATPYTITASNASGSATVVLDVTVLEAVLPPTSLTYSENPAVYTVGTPIAPNLPVNSGGLIAAYTVSPTTPLPAGLSLDTATGILTGTPTAITTGPTTCTVTGQNAAGVTSVDLVVTVNNPVLAIVTQPANQSALPGGTATFSVVASGTNLRYQWKATKLGTTTDVGTGQSSYTTPVLAPDDDGSTFRVVVTDDTGSLTSRDAALSLRGFFPLTARMVNHPVYGHTATLLDDGRVLIAGGNVQGAASTAIAQLYDPATRTFVRTSNDMSTPRQGHVAVKLLDGRVLIAGGCRAAAFGCTQFWSTIEIFDPDTSQFLDPATFPQMATPRAYLAAALLPGADGRVLLAGGYVNGTTMTASADVFVPDARPGSGTIVATGSMSTPRAFPATVALPDDGTVLVAGGQAVESNVPVALSSAEKYRLAIGDDPRTQGLFSATGALSGGRSNGVATPPRVGPTEPLLLPVLLTGGNGSGMRPTNPAALVPGLLGVQQFDVATFAATGPLAAERNWQTATRLPGTGEVLVTGGNSMATYLASAEIHDPILGVSTPAPSMSTPRAQHTATLLPDGTVLVAGGRTGPVGSVGTTLNSAEVWAPYPYPPVP